MFCFVFNPLSISVTNPPNHQTRRAAPTVSQVPVDDLSSLRVGGDGPGEHKRAGGHRHVHVALVGTLGGIVTTFPGVQRQDCPVHESGEARHVPLAVAGLGVVQ